MNVHFSSFTPEAIRAFGQDLADGFQRRAEFLANTRKHTFAMLASFRKESAGAEVKRRERASREADARRLFMSELKSGVHSLLGRFELSRKEMAGDLQEMARELHAASDAFRNRPGHQDGGVRRSTGQQPKQAPSSMAAKPFRTAPESQGGSKASASTHPFRTSTEAQDGPNARSGADDKPGDPKKHPGDAKKQQE